MSFCLQMVGVGTVKAELDLMHQFCSLLGHNHESWGFSYRGVLQYGGEKREYGKCFGQGSLVGVHFDAWRGTLQFFLNRKPLGKTVFFFFNPTLFILLFQLSVGIAFTGLRNLELYPMVSSTAAQSQVRITRSCSVPASLQLDCLAVLRPLQWSYVSTAFPGLRYLSKSIFADILRKHNGNQCSKLERVVARFKHYRCIGIFIDQQWTRMKTRRVTSFRKNFSYSTISTTRSSASGHDENARNSSRPVRPGRRPTRRESHRASRGWNYEYRSSSRSASCNYNCTGNISYSRRKMNVVPCIC